MAAVSGRGLGYLHRQFASRRQHQDARAVNDAFFTALGVIGAGRQHALQCGQDECSGLAAAGAGRNHQVMASERGRNGLGLHFGGGVVTRFGHSFGQGFLKAQGIETHFFLFQKAVPTYRSSARLGAPAVHRWIRPVRSPQRSGNSQSDGIAANHYPCVSRPPAGKCAETCIRWWEIKTGRTTQAWGGSKEVRGNERNAGNTQQAPEYMRFGLTLTSKHRQLPAFT